MTRNETAVIMDESYIRSARDRFLELGKKDLLNDEELWILVQANAQYLGLVEAHRELRKNIGGLSKKDLEDLDQSSTDLVSALFFTSQIINIVGGGQDPVNIESMVLDGKSGESKYKKMMDSLSTLITDTVGYQRISNGESKYKNMMDSLSTSISGAVAQRRISKEPHNWFIECGYHRLALPKGTKVITHARELEWHTFGGKYEKVYYDCADILLKAKVEQPSQTGVITCGERVTVVKILECVDWIPYITQYFNFRLNISRLPDLVGKSKQTTGRLWIDLKENPGSLAEVVKFMAGYERERFMENGGIFARERCFDHDKHRYAVKDANIFR